MILVKQQLYALCLEQVEMRIATAEDAIKAAREAMEGDSKSSAGDKYETTREMMQQEIDRNQRQLVEARKLKIDLDRIVPGNKIATQVQPGCIVETNRGIFYVSVSAGQLTVTNKIYYAISPSSPVGRMLAGKKAGEDVTFNGKIFSIHEIF